MNDLDQVSYHFLLYIFALKKIIGYNHNMHMVKFDSGISISGNIQTL